MNGMFAETKSETRLRSLKEILDDVRGNHFKFFIPAYQRGYRWMDTEVKQLLEDVAADESGGYFLQLLAVRRDENGKRLRIVDGQQRLTTCLLALETLSARDERPPNDLRDLEYETREPGGGGIDKVYRDRAQTAISNYLGKHSKDDRSQLTEKILSCRFLYHDVGVEEEEMPLFHRLNMWKMPMRDSELVKCLVLGKEGGDARGARIKALQWEQIERRLEDKNFLAFLAREPEKHLDDKFGLFLRVAMGFKGQGNVKSKTEHEAESREKFPLFAAVSRKERKECAEFWEDAVQTFRQVEAWYADSYKYHLLGWHLHCRCQRSAHDELLNESTFAHAKAHAEEIADTSRHELSYGVDDEVIRDYLFLANVAFCALSFAPRYNFGAHVAEKPWSIEHVHARNQRQLTKEEFDSRFAKHKDLTEYWDTYYNDWRKDGVKAEDGLWKRCQKHKIDYPTPDVDNGIGNLALLTDRMNSSFNNGPFEEKRNRVRNGWAPPLTIAVFEKMIRGLDEGVGYWTPNDRKVYEEFLKETIGRFRDMERFIPLWEGACHD